MSSKNGQELLDELTKILNWTDQWASEFNWDNVEEIFHDSLVKESICSMKKYETTWKISVQEGYKSRSDKGWDDWDSLDQNYFAVKLLDKDGKDANQENVYKSFREFVTKEFPEDLKQIDNDLDTNDLDTSVINEKSDRKAVLTAVQKDGGFQKNGWVLQNASEACKADREIVLAAVKTNGWSLEYAAETLQIDREIVLAAVKQSGSVLSHSTTKWGMNIKFGHEDLQKKCIALMTDREIFLEAVKSDGEALQYASEDFKNDKEIVLAAVKQDGSALLHASEALRNDPEIVAASKQ